MTLETTSPIAIWPWENETDLQTWIKFRGGSDSLGRPIPPPTDAFYNITFGDDTGENSFIYEYMVINRTFWIDDFHTYHSIGTYNLTLNISNFVNWMYFERKIYVDNPVMNMTAWATPWIVRVNETSEITVNMTWGSRYNLTWDWKDPNNNTNPTIYFDWYNRTMKQSHWYVAPFVYPVTLTATNSWNTTVIEIEKPLIVQHIIRDIKMDCSETDPAKLRSPSWIANWSCEIKICGGHAHPTNVTMNVSFGDLPINDQFNVPFTNNITDRPPDADGCKTHGEIVHPRGFYEGGTYIVNITMSNLVSNASMSWEIDVWEELYDIKFPLKWIWWTADKINNTDNANETAKLPVNDGFAMTPGGPKKYFPCLQEHGEYGETCIFKTSHFKGSHMHYHWYFDDSGPWGPAGTMDKVDNIWAHYSFS